MFEQVARDLSAVPLAAVDAIVLDTETTGLDVANDRIVEIGAVRVRGSEILDGETFEALVNPGRPIPAAARDIHGISDADVANAARFADVMPGFSNWAGPSLVIGYSIGFDLAILKAEHLRCNLEWRAPRYLDVRHLAQIVAPNLPEQSLDMTAQWLELEVQDRHRALGDARMTARVFAALVARLKERNILTLAQAERAGRSLVSRRREEEQAGWHDETGDQPQRADAAVYARIDSYPYRHRVSDLMASPPLMIDGSARLEAALATMAERQVSSLFLPPTEEAPSYGIVTERDVLRAIHACGAEALADPVSTFAKRPLVTIDGDTFVYKALARMSGRGFRHLGVTDASGNLIGALSARDLLHQRADDAVALGNSVELAATPAQLGRVWSSLTAAAKALVQEDVDARDIAAVISHELRALTRRACELAEAAMLAAGEGGPPGRYAMLVLGSGGRGESLLAMDQDNAIIFDQQVAGAEARSWYERLGVRVADILDGAGVAYCKGGVMAAKADWRKDEMEWRETVEGWLSRSRPTDILNSDIFFDALPVHGDKTLADDLRNHAIAKAQASRVFLSTLALKASNFEDPAGWFGRLKLKNGRVDLKLSGIMPIFSAARVVALRHAIPARSTRDRLLSVRDLDTMPPGTIDDLIAAHGILLSLILRQQLRDLDKGLRIGNSVDPNELSAHERQELMWATRQIPKVADLLGTPQLG